MKTFIISVSVLLVMTFPIVNRVDINKDDIIKNYAFAGTLVLKDNPDDEVFVGTDMCCKYWLDKDNQPMNAQIRTVRYGLISYLFYLGTGEIV
jgi:hypothetical protein